MHAPRVAPITLSAAPSVRGSMHFLKPTRQRLQLAVEGPSSGKTNGEYRSTTVDIRDLRQTPGVNFGLDTTGFKLVSFSPSNVNWDNESQVRCQGLRTCFRQQTAVTVVSNKAVGHQSHVGRAPQLDHVIRCTLVMLQQTVDTIQALQREKSILRKKGKWHP